MQDRIPKTFRYNEIPGNILDYETEYALALATSADFSMSDPISQLIDNRYKTREWLKNAYPHNTWQSKGECYISNDNHIFNLIVKARAWQKASYENVREALQSMREIALERNIVTIAMPRICCEYDGLDWNIIHDMIFEVFDGDEIEIKVVYEKEFIHGEIKDGELDKEMYRKCKDKELSGRYF